ncbi:MFS transporter [Dictyobacter sp. S3.2.2.5]|uniref:MFS transporter n=1 Tax=Dictyobacter halimunensis TaxID=3026934 RepID=A0ABQ6G3R5_9CHLR|nr:MFS transporter [Dictyobacter sp. S3.2.2.5]
MRLKVRAGQLWRSPDFLKLWAGETVSLLGSQVTNLALPLLVILTLRATALQVTLLNAVLWAPYLCFPLFAGWWVDRHRRRPLLIIADLCRAVLLGLLPLAAALHLLRIELVYLVALLVGLFTVIFDLAYKAYLPAILGREHLVEGNSKLQLSSSVAQIGGPGLGGLLVQLLTAPFALLFDACSFLVSALGVLLIRQREEAPASTRTAGSMWRQIGAGLQLTFHNPYLRLLALAAMTYNLFSQVMMALFVVYATRELQIAPALLGTIIAAGSIGALGGSLLAGPLARRVGLGPALIYTGLIECLPLILLPLAAGPQLLKILLLMAAFIFNGVGLSCGNIYYPSLRQALAPREFLGRVTASYSWLSLGAVPLGALLAGGLQGWIGLRGTLLCGAVGTLLSVIWLCDARLRKLRTLPQQVSFIDSEREK